MPALLALIPLKDWIYCGIIVALISFGVYGYAHLIHEGEAEAYAKVAAVTKAAEAKRQKELAAQAVEDQKTIDTIRTTYETQLATAASAASGLNARLRAYESASSRVLALSGDPATSAGPDAPAAKPAGVEQSVEGVVSAAGHDAAQVIQLQAYIAQECH